MNEAILGSWEVSKELNNNIIVHSRKALLINTLLKGDITAGMSKNEI